MAKSVRLITCQASLYLGYSLQNAYIIYGAQRRQISKIQGRSSGAGEIVGNAAVIAVIGAFIALGVLGVLFYVSTLAKNVYQIKIQMKDDLAYELDRLKDHVEKEMLQRQKWITRDVASVSDAKFDLVDGEMAALKSQVRADLNILDEKLRKLSALQQAMAAKPNRQEADFDEPDLASAFAVDSVGRKAAQ